MMTTRYLDGGLDSAPGFILFSIGVVGKQL